VENNKFKVSDDLRDGGKLMLNAVTGITKIVEAMHYRITDMIPIPGIKYIAGSKGIPRLIYKLIYAVTGRVNNGLEEMLSKLSKILDDQTTSPNREAFISALNGVLGDYLALQNNSLAIKMQFRQNGSPLHETDLKNYSSLSNQKFLILIHGSCMNDIQWTMNEHNHGEALSASLNYKPLYLHYNTGLHISENGKLLSDLLEKTFSNNISAEIHILAHSMGGLVSRSACYFALKENKKWLKNLSKIVFLGTPHHGAPLEKAGNWIDKLLAAKPYTAPLSKLGQIRSAGITDMRYGNITHDDWKNHHRFFSKGDKRIPVPLPDDIKCYTVAAITAQNPGLSAHHLIGDGMVTLSSALGEHPNKDFNLIFSENQKLIVYKTGHLELLYFDEVYNKIFDWLAENNMA
jgi:hypothetical protein